MATYFWVGGATGGLSGSAYDWNYSKNWRKITNLTTYSSTVATTVPGPGDVVHIGSWNSKDTKLNTTLFNLRPIAPLLWGGFKPTSGLTSNGTWITGATLGGAVTQTVQASGYTGALKELNVRTGHNSYQIDLPTFDHPGYRFSMLGIDPVYRDPTMDQNLMAEDMFNHSADQIYTSAGLTLIESWTQNDWLYAIQNSLLSTSGITNGLYVKAETVNYSTYPNPAYVFTTGISRGLNGADTTACVNIVDNFIGLTGGISNPTWSQKYNTSVFADFNGGNIKINEAKLSQLVTTFNQGGVDTSTGQNYPTYKSTGTIYLSNTKVANAVCDIWSNFSIDNRCEFGSIGVNMYGPYSFGSPTSPTNPLGTFSIRLPGETSDGALIFDSKVLISGKYSPSVYKLFYTDNANVSYTYRSGEYTAIFRVYGGKKSPDSNPVISSNSDVSFSLPGHLVLNGITADGILLQAEENYQPPRKFFTWNKETNSFECNNELNNPGPCSNGKLRDYLSDVYLTGQTFTALEMRVENLDVNVPLDTSSYKPVYNFGKLELFSSNLDLKSGVPNPPDWRFGLITSSASGVTLNGGLIADEYSTIEGAQNVRFLNYYVDPVTKINTRTGKQINEGIILTPPTSFPPISGEA